MENWQTYIRGLPAADRAAEERIFDNFSQGDLHFAAWIDSGKEIVDEI